MPAQMPAPNVMSSPTPAPGPARMKAIIQHRYGSPDVLELQDIPRPPVGDDDVLVRVRAASINALDWRLLRGQPYIARLMGMGVRRPRRRTPGVDLAGVVEAVGAAVTDVIPGDEVIGHTGGSCAEYVIGTSRHFVPKPARVTFEQAAAVPVAGLTALQGLRDVGWLRPGQTVLINGAGGGVGTFAVQIAKALGAEVTAVTSPRHLELVRSIGADRVLDYTREDFTRGGERYDVMFDIGGNRSISACRRILRDEGTLVIVGGPAGGWLGPVAQLLSAAAQRRFVRQRLAWFMTRHSREDLLALTGLLEAGTLTPVIDRVYPLRQTAEAIHYLETGQARGKVVIAI